MNRLTGSLRRDLGGKTGGFMCGFYVCVGACIVTPR